MYVPDVIVFRIGGREVPHFCVSVVAASGIYEPDTSEDGLEQYRKELDARICGVLRTCAAHGHKHLVLGAWGCGSLQNPPEEVARAFSRALIEPADTCNCFERVVFAIRNDPASFQAFSKVFDP